MAPPGIMKQKNTPEAHKRYFNWKKEKKRKKK